MGTKRLVGGLCVTTAAVIAACIGGTPTEGTSTQLVLQVGPGSHNFGPVMVGFMATSSPPFIISSIGSNDDDVITDITESCGDFSLNLSPPPQGYRIYCDDGVGTASVAGGSGSGACIPNSYAFTANFMPTGGGSSSCTVTVSYELFGGGGSDFFNITLQGYGQAATNSLTISPPNGSIVPFGDIPVGQLSNPQTVTITNDGTNPLLVTGNFTGPYQFTPPLTPQSLPGPGSFATYQVRCQPTIAGPANGTLNFTSAAPPVGVALNCNGVTASLNASPIPGSFASTLVGRAPADLDITITNPGSATTLAVTLVPTSAELTFAAGGDPNGNPIAAGGTAHAILHYSGASEHPMAQLGTLNVNRSVGGMNLAIAISGEALTGTLGVSPGTAIDFGPVCVGAMASEDVTLYATASGAISVTSVSPPSPPFAATSASGVLLANHGTTRMFAASVAPTAAGDLSDKLVVHTNLPTMPDREIALTATALPAGVSPTPDTVHFGPQHVMITTTTKEVIVSNCGSSPITFSSARIEGASAAEFSLVSEIPMAAVGQKASTKFLIVMQPQTNGQKVAQLILTYDGGEVAIDLDGNGFGGDEGSDDEEDTYYSKGCNGGGASTGASFALGLLVLGRRRRRR